MLRPRNCRFGSAVVLFESISAWTSFHHCVLEMYLWRYTRMIIMEIIQRSTPLSVVHICSYMPESMIETSPYSLLVPDDVSFSARSHQIMIESGQKVCGSCWS